MKSNKFWIVTFLIIVFISALTAFFVMRTSASPVTVARVYQDGVLIKEIALSDIYIAQTFYIENDRGTNVIIAENGRIRVSQADCPDKICVRQGWIKNSLFPVVCLPHRLVIEIFDDNAPIVDAVVR